MSPLLFVLSLFLFFSNTERVQRHQSVCCWRIGSPRERAESNWHPCRAGGEPPPLSHGHRYGAQLHCKQFWQIERSQTLIEFWKCESLKPECSAELPWKWKGCDLLPPLWALVIRVPSWEVITRPDIVWASTIEQCAQPCRAWIHICASLICPCLEKKIVRSSVFYRFNRQSVLCVCLKRRKLASYIPHETRCT